MGNLRLQLAARALGIFALVGLVLVIGAIWWVPEFTYSFPHERDLYRALGDSSAENIWRGPEVKPGDRIWGGGYYLLLKTSAWLGDSWLLGSARLALLLHAAFVGILLVFGRQIGLRGPLVILVPMLLLFSSHLVSNLEHLWNPSYLPFFLALSLAAGYAAHNSRGSRRTIWMVLSVAAIAFATQLHAAAWVYPCAFVAAWISQLGGRRGVLAVLAISVTCVGGASALFPEVVQARIDSLTQLWSHLTQDASVFATSPGRRWALTARHVVDVGALTIIILAICAFRHSGATFWEKWCRWCIGLSLIPALYAIGWYVSTPHNFKDRYWVPVIVASAFMATIRLRRPTSTIWNVLPPAIGALLFLGVRLGAPAKLAPENYLIAVTGLILAASCWRFGGKHYARAFTAAAILGATSGIAAYQSAAPPEFFHRPMGSYLTLAQGTEMSAFFRRSRSWDWASLHPRLFLLGFQSNSAFAYFHENVRSSTPGGNPVPAREIAVVVGWAKDETSPPVNGCSPRLLELISEKHDWIRALLSSGQAVPRECYVSQHHVGGAILELIGETARIAAVGNYGYPAYLTFTEKCHAPLDEAPCLRGNWRLDAGGRVRLELLGSAIGDRDSDRLARWHATNLAAELICSDGSSRTVSLVPRTIRTTAGTDTLFPARWSVMMDGQMLAPAVWSIPSPCAPGSVEAVNFRWDRALVFTDSGPARLTAPAGKLEAERRSAP